MKRRSFIALAATIPLAGCGILGGSGGVSDSIDARDGNLHDMVSESFDASEGDQYDVTIEAGSDGAFVSLLPEEGSVDETDLMGGEQLEVGSWDLDPDEEETETVEIEEDDTYVFFAWEGSADVTAE